MITRRTLIASGTALAAMPSMAFAAERADVAIIGAGLSGMNAAMLLRDLGYKVIVLEAGNRVGGRVQTADTFDGRIDLGASQIGRTYARVIDACEKFNLKLIPEDRDLLSFGAHYRDTWIDNKTWESNPLNLTKGDERRIPPMLMGQQMAARYNPLTELDQWLDPKYAADDISLRQLMQRNGHSEAAIELASLSTPGIGIDETSVLRMWQEEVWAKVDKRMAPPANHGDRDHPFGEVNDRNLVAGLASLSNIEGGTDRLTSAMGASLGNAIRFGKRVGRIAMTDRSARITCTDGSQVNARFVISAIPFSMLRNVVITGHPNPKGQMAIRQMPYANTARLFMTVDKPFWKEDGLPPCFSTDGPIGMFWAINNHTGEGMHRVMVIMVGKVALAMSSRDRPAAEGFILNELARLRPASKGLLKIATYKDWQRDPLFNGCGFSLAPGHVNAYARDMIKPWQVMHFAGEHTRRLAVGMEAAMESGERAALEIAERG